MKITLNIATTPNGESRYMLAAQPGTGQWRCCRAVEMNLVSPDMWQLPAGLENDPGNFDYRFIVKARRRSGDSSGVRRIGLCPEGIDSLSNILLLAGSPG